MTRRRDGHYPQYFPEAAEHSGDGLGVPLWDRLELESRVMRATLLDRARRGSPLPPVALDVPDRRKFGTVVSPYPPEWFDLRNIFCFQYLPAVAAIKDATEAAIGRSAGFNGLTPEGRLLNGLPKWKGVAVEVDAQGRALDDPRAAYRRQIAALKEQTRAELAHSLYHHAMWRAHGRHVYVLDATTYDLLAETPLPKLPASILSAPHHSFYLALPPEAFEFGVWNRQTETIDRQPIEGVFIALDNITPDSPQQRELAFMPVGQGATITDRNIAFFSIALGPDASLHEITMPFAAATPKYDGPDHSKAREMEEWGLGKNGGYELGVVIPRVIISLLLYLASEHPDIEPVAPAVRRTFTDIRSPKQRRAALDRQAQTLRGATRLPILHVGAHLQDEIAAERTRVTHAIAADSGRTWHLDHPVWVKGHWKQQPHGEGRALRKIIWIRPYLKGPDMAASLTVHAAKIQRAQPAGS